jgi:hypothetical protein
MSIHKNPRSLARLACIVVVCVTAACTGMGARTVDVPMDKLQASLDKRFPMNTTFAELFDLKIIAPKLSAMPAANRIATELGLSLLPRFTKRSFEGTLTMDSELRFEASDSTVRLVNPHVQSFDLPGFKLSDTAQGDLNLGKLAAGFIESAMNDMVVHEVKTDDLKRLGTQWKPQDIKVTASGLSVTLLPQK